jgi:hypothetical protein
LQEPAKVVGGIFNAVPGKQIGNDRSIRPAGHWHIGTTVHAEALGQSVQERSPARSAGQDQRPINVK